MTKVNSVCSYRLSCERYTTALRSQQVCIGRPLFTGVFMFLGALILVQLAIIAAYFVRRISRP